MAASSLEDHERNDMGELSDDESVIDDYDIATLHERNAVLMERATVKSFQKGIDGCKSLADDKTRDWLTNLPFYQRKEAFPLFTDGEKSRDDSTDYQLHPHYTLLEFSKTAVQPHDSLCRLQKGDVILDDPDLVVGVGRLFVNIRNGKGGRTTKWTGYEVFVDQKLAVWVVFDRSSNDPRAAGWYPELCELLPPIPQRPNNKQNIDIACFLSSLHNVGHAQSKEASQNGFEKARDMVENSKQLGKMTVCQVEHSEAKRLLEAEQNTLDKSRNLRCS
ncbi:MAG: hypothetical protein HETSPECPRED_002859 [Heterodermia speciosa]|uniref:Uncharacterized protein n=1 Tax=Heterodermia speciosa TaxID=116794 RepID=A0A8H3PHU4_9LECA|nr:MAG: hypothetical protein HETSPECPRED_002859 [Heterodermia speciosa]